jgi:hypothetical protein
VSRARARSAAGPETLMPTRKAPTAAEMPMPSASPDTTRVSPKTVSRLTSSDV